MICTYVEWIGRTYIFFLKFKEKIATFPQVYMVLARKWRGADIFFPLQC